MKTSFRRRKAEWTSIVGCVIALMLGTLSVHAQTVTGSVTGFVTDTSGAIIPSAKVIAHNLNTGVDASATTNTTGLYRIDFLPIGRYQVMVEANGFNKQSLPAFNLEVLQTATFNVKLSVGSATQTVEVSASSPILNTYDPTLGTTFTANTIANVPLSGLDFSALTLYVPGAVDTAGVAGASSIERSTEFTDTPNFNGNRSQGNNYTLDGIDMNETFNNLISYSPAPEALQEIKVLTANSPADYGNVDGGGIVAVLKSGTNNFHGTAYGYEQNQKFNANAWVNNHASPQIPINPFNQAQFGGTLGGPILHDKLFFFVDYLGSRRHTGGLSTASVFTAKMREGDFSALLGGQHPVLLYDSENNFKPYTDDAGVPILNPVAKFLFAHPEYYPLPNAQPSDEIASNDLQGPKRIYQANNQGDIKIEYDPVSSDKITGFFSISTAYDGQTSVLPVSFSGVSLFPTKLFGANWVHSFSSTIVNSGRLGFTRTTWVTGVPADPTGAFGLTGNQKVGIPFGTQSYVGFSGQGISGLSTAGNPAQGGGLIDNTYSYIDDITWQRGRHFLSIGVQALRFQNNYPTSNNDGYLGTLSYNGSFTTNPNIAKTVSGYGGADFLLDRVSSANATLSTVNVGQRQWRAAGYVNDDFKVMPNLTLNIGVRYEFDQPWVEENNKTGNVDVTTGQVLYAHSVPAGAPAGSGICSNSACYDANYKQIMPRVGFAYQATDKFVVRGGYGATSFFEGNSSNQRLTSITPFIQAVQISTLSPSAATATTPASGGTPRTAEEGFSHTSSDIALGGSYNVYPKNIQPAYVQEWSLTTEYALSRSTSLQVGYIGEQGQHIEDYGNVNQWRVNNDPTSAPLYNSANFGSGSLLITESRAMMNFNALESTLRQRVSHGLEFTLNYTYGKAMTNSVGNYSLAVNGYSGAFQNYYDSAADYGPAGSDVRHNVSGTGVYALPVGRGQEYFSSANRFVDEAIGGWKLSVAGVAYSGFPDSLTGPGNNSQSYGNSRPNQYGPLKIVHRSIDHWFGTDPSAIPCTDPGQRSIGGVAAPCAFGIPANNAFGTSRNGIIRGPSYINIDMSAFKEFHVVREQSIGFRFDAFNALNLVSYGSPDIGITDSNFGNISNQGNASYQGQGAVRSVERHIQFSARYSF